MMTRHKLLLGLALITTAACQDARLELPAGSIRCEVGRKSKDSYTKTYNGVQWGGDEPFLSATIEDVNFAFHEQALGKDQSGKLYCGVATVTVSYEVKNKAKLDEVSRARGALPFTCAIHVEAVTENGTIFEHKVLNVNLSDFVRNELDDSATFRDMTANELEQIRTVRAYCSYQ